MSSVWYYALFLLLAGSALVVLGLMVQSRNRSSLSTFFVMTVFTTAIYTIGYGMEITRNHPAAIEMWSRFEYFGLPFIASFLLLFVVQYTADGRRIPRIVIAVPLIISAMIMVFRQTTQFHGLYYGAVTFPDRGDYMVMSFEKGPVYWFQGAYNIICMMISAILVVRHTVHGDRNRRRAGFYLFAGILVPVLPYVIWVAGLIPLDIDIVPAGLAAATFFFYIALLRHNLFSLVPAGRHFLIETMTEAVFVLDRNGRVADANPAACLAFGCEFGSPAGRRLAEAFPFMTAVPEDGDRVKADGRIWEMGVTDLTPLQGRADGLLVVARDVTRRELLVERLETMAREDGLTGLLNRHSWDSAVKTELSRLSRTGRPGSVIYLDLDHFKDVNDSHGHAVGDAVMESVAGVITRGLRRPDLAGRYGGEEFVIFLPETPPEIAFDVAERLRISLEASEIESETGGVKVTGSFGVCGGLIDHEVRLEDLVSRADAAMYASKRGGRNRVSLF